MDDRNAKPGPSVDRDDRELAERLHALERELDKGRAARDTEASRDAAPARPGMALGFRLAADFVAGVVLGAALGWGLDRLLGTSPWGLVVFLLLGFAAGILNAMRSAGLLKPGPPGPDDRPG